jgi:hypothetical protein
MFALICGERVDFHAEQFPIHDVIERGPQAAMVVILKRHKAERLQHALCHLLHRAEDFGHSVHRASLRLEGNFHEVTLRQRLRQLQQATGNGNGLEFSFGAAAVF